MKRQVPLIIAFIAGFVMLCDYFIPHKDFRPIPEMFLTWVRIIFGFAIVLGAGSLTVSHLSRISKAGKESIHSGILVICIFLALILGLLLTSYIGSEKLKVVCRFAVIVGVGLSFRYFIKRTSKTGQESFYSWVLLASFAITLVVGLLWKTDLSQPAGYIFKYCYTPLSATMFALLAFFIASAAFRAFRLKNVESGLLLTAATLVMVGRIPLGNLIWKYVPGVSGICNLSQIQEWLTLNPVTAAQRTILMGAALGAIAISIKILAGIDRSYFGGGE